MWTCGSHNSAFCGIAYHGAVLLYHTSTTSELAEQGVVAVPNMCFWLFALVGSCLYSVV